MSLLLEIELFDASHGSLSHSPPPAYSPAAVATHFSPPSLSVSKDSAFPAMMSYSSQPESPSLPQKVGDASKLAAGSSAAATMKEPLSPTPAKLYKLDDFKDLTYQGILLCIYIILPVHFISDLPLCKNYVYIYYMVFTTALIFVFISAQHNCIYIYIYI